MDYSTHAKLQLLPEEMGVKALQRFLTPLKLELELVQWQQVIYSLRQLNEMYENERLKGESYYEINAIVLHLEGQLDNLVIEMNKRTPVEELTK